jgi:hypothetical protein
MVVFLEQLCLARANYFVTTSRETHDCTLCAGQHVQRVAAQ